MKNYLKPDAEIYELDCDDVIMGQIGSGDFGIEDGEGGGWED